MALPQIFGFEDVGESEIVWHAVVIDLKFAYNNQLCPNKPTLPEDGS